MGFGELEVLLGPSEGSTEENESRGPFNYISWVFLQLCTYYIRLLFRDRSAPRYAGEACRITLNKEEFAE